MSTRRYTKDTKTKNLKLPCVSCGTSSKHMQRGAVYPRDTLANGTNAARSYPRHIQDQKHDAPWSFLCPSGSTAFYTTTRSSLLRVVWPISARVRLLHTAVQRRSASTTEVFRLLPFFARRLPRPGESEHFPQNLEQNLHIISVLYNKETTHGLRSHVRRS